MFDGVLNTPSLLRDQYEQTMQQIYDRQQDLTPVIETCHPPEIERDVNKQVRSKRKKQFS